GVLGAVWHLTRPGEAIESAPERAAPTSQVLTPREVHDRFRKIATVEMTVRSVHPTQKFPGFFLNSEKNYQTEGNLVLIVTEEGTKAFGKKNVHSLQDYRAYFEGKTIQATGIINSHEGRLQIRIKDADQIRFVKH